MHRSRAVVLAAALVAAVGCTADERPAPAAPVAGTTTPTPTAAVDAAWSASTKVRPDWVGRDAPWLWEYSDDVVVIGPRGLVSLDRETGAEVWRLPLGGPVCGATPVPSEIGLVAVSVGRCRPALQPTRNGSGFPSGEAATARRTVIKGVDLESASVVWERPFMGAPSLDIGGEVLLATAGCGARRIDLSTGRTLSALDVACSERLLVGQGVAVVSSETSRGWRAIDVASGEPLAEVAGPTSHAPERVLTNDPLTVLAPNPVSFNTMDLVRVEDQSLRVVVPRLFLGVRPFLARSGDSLVVADELLPGASEFSMEDGSVLGGIPGVPAELWIPFDLYGDGILGFEGDSEGLNAGRGRLTLRSLRDGSVTEVGEWEGTEYVGDTNLAVAAPKAVVIGNMLLMPGHGNGGVLAHRLTLPPVD